MDEYSTKDVTKILMISVSTLKNWYYWSKSKYNNATFIFPEPKRDEKGRMLFNKNDLKILLEFKNKLRYGDMSEFNRRYK